MTVIAQEKAAPTADGIISQLLGPPKGKWGQRIATATAAVTAGRAIYQTARNRWNLFHYSIGVFDNDELYVPVQQWLIEHMPPEARKALTAHTSRADGPESVSDGSARVGRQLRLFYDGSRVQEVDIGGHRVMVAIEREGPAGQAENGYKWRPDRIVFQMRNVEARDAVVGFLRQIAADLEANRTSPRLFTATRWGEWYTNRNMMPRPLQSVVLRHGQMERLIGDLARFYADEASYVRLGIPWHRGYLFHGPPGTGKTSAAKAIAMHLGLDMFYVPLADLQTDTDLDRLVNGVHARSVLLLEDIDTLAASQHRVDGDSDAKGITLTGLLNALDGVVTPHGLVTIMTTNRPGDLDDALVRRGRADLIEEMGLLDAEQCRRLVRNLTYWQPSHDWLPAKQAEARGWSAADVVEIVKQHLDDQHGAVVALCRALDCDPAEWA